MEQQHLRRREAAQYLGCSPGFLEKHATRGGGPPFIKLSARLVVYRVADLDRWLADRQCASTSESDRQ